MNRAIRGTLRETLEGELGLESCHFYKILNEKPILYLFNSIPNLNRIHNIRRSNNVPLISLRRSYYSFPLLLYQSGTKLT